MKSNKDLLFVLIILFPIVISNILILFIIDNRYHVNLFIEFSVINFLPFLTIIGPALFKNKDDYNTFFNRKIILSIDLFLVIFAGFLIIQVPFIVFSYVFMMEAILGYASLSTLKDSQSAIIGKIFSFLTCIAHLFPLFLIFGLPSGFGSIATYSFLISFCAWFFYFARKRYFHGIVDSFRDSRPFFTWFIIFSMFYIISWPFYTEVWHLWYHWNSFTLYFLFSLEIVFFLYGALIGYQLMVN